VLALDWNRVPYLRAAFVAMLPLGIGLRDLLVWARTRYCLTTDSLTRAGPHPATWPLSEIETVELRQSLPERWLKFGDLRLFTAGDPGVVYLEKLTSPERLQRALLEQLTRQDRTLRSAIPELIAGLDQLRRTGALSEAEFQAQKERLLRQL
jgi:hypothetical protein